MTDRELLELAAKAAGYNVQWCLNGVEGDEIECFVFIETGERWTPYDDDGDDLRLEVKLKLTAAWEPNRGGWSLGGIVNDEFKWLAFDEDRKRATIRAAAEIGRTV